MTTLVILNNHKLLRNSSLVNNLNTTIHKQGRSIICQLSNNSEITHKKFSSINLSRVLGWFLITMQWIQRMKVSISQSQLSFKKNKMNHKLTRTMSRGSQLNKLLSQSLSCKGKVIKCLKVLLRLKIKQQKVRTIRMTYLQRTKSLTSDRTSTYLKNKMEQVV